MTIKQIRNFYEDKKMTPCPLTDNLIKLGYQQRTGGYIAKAKSLGIEVDYNKALPTQWWHLIKSYCEIKNDDDIFPFSVKCGELYFWMAEVSGVFTQEELTVLMKKAIEACDKDETNNNIPPLHTPKGNLIIRDYCFYRIKEFIEKYEKN